MKRLVLEVPRGLDDPRVDRFLVRAVPWLTAERARRLLEDGRVSVRGKPCRPNRRLWGGEQLAVDLPPPEPAPPAPDGPPLVVLHADDDVVVIDKPAGLVVEEAGPHPSVAVLAAAQLGRFDVDGRALPGIVHRLDRGTTGCLALARNDAARAALDRAFDEKQVDKRYLALVLGTPPDSARIETPYARDPRDRNHFTTRVPSPRRAALSYEVRSRFDGGALLEVRLETGRTHQIRVQLADAGLPVLGDPIYGPVGVRTHPAARALGRQALHAWRLSFPHPGTGARLACEAPVPPAFLGAMDSLSPGWKGLDSAS